MSKRITKCSLQAYSDSLRNQGMDSCIEAHGLQYHNGQQYAALKERAEVLRRIANELDALLDGTLK